MAEFQMQELALPTEDGKKVLYPRMCIRRKVELERLVKHIKKGTSYSEGEITGLIKDLARAVAQEMADGNSVHVEGLGLFTPSLGLKEGVERESGIEGSKRLNAASICLRSVNFRPDKELLQETEQYMELSRSDKKFLRSSAKYTPEERLALAKEYLEQHPFLTVSDYSQLTGLLRSTAAIELKRWAETEGSGIGRSGRGSHKIYIKQ